MAKKYSSKIGLQPIFSTKDPNGNPATLGEESVQRIRDNYEVIENSLNTLSQENKGKADEINDKGTVVRTLDGKIDVSGKADEINDNGTVVRTSDGKIANVDVILQDGDITTKSGNYLFQGKGELSANTGSLKNYDESILTIDNTYLSSTGTTSSGSLYKTSDFIEIDPSEFVKIIFYGFGPSSSSRALAFYDSAKILLSVAPNVNASFDALQEIAIPSTAVYFRISRNKSSRFSCKLIGVNGNVATIKNTENELSVVSFDGNELTKTFSVKNPNLLFADTETVPDENMSYLANKGLYPFFGGAYETFGKEYLTKIGSYINRSTGAIVSNSAYNCTELLPIEDINQFIYTSVPSATACGIAYYNNGTFLSSDIENQSVSKPPSNATHYRLCGRSDQTYSVFIYRTSSESRPILVDSLSLLEYSEGTWNIIPVGSNNATQRTTKQIASVKDFVVSGTTTPNGISISEVNQTDKSQIQFPVETYIERIAMYATFTVSSDTPLNFRFGKGYTVCTVNSETSKIEIKGYNGILETIDLDFELVNGSKYTVGFDKIDAVFFKLFIYGVNGYFEKTYSKYNSLQEKGVAIAWGKPFFGVNNGDVSVEDVILTSDYDIDSEFCIAGDSFIEGTSLLGTGDSLDDRWCYLVSEKIGKMRTVINGKGGEVIDANFINRFKRELSWFPNIKYVIISLGTNNSGFGAYKTHMEALITYLKSVGITPILVTVTPRSGFPIAEMNNFVRTSGELYIDMNKAVSLATDETKWKSGFAMSDGTHPTPLGHKYMYHRSIMDLPEVYI